IEQRQYDEVLARFRAKYETADRALAILPDPETRLKVMQRALALPDGPIVDLGDAPVVEEKSSRPTWNDTVNTKPRQPRKRAIANRHNLPWMKGYYLRIQNDLVDELIDVMSAPLLKGYVYASRVASSRDGVARFAHETLAEKIGATGKRRATYGKRIV